MNGELLQKPQRVNTLNLNRKHTLIDDNIKTNLAGMPLPSWIEFSPVDLCNRTCEFCPRADPEIAPNRNNHMSLEFAEKISGELVELEFEGTIVFGGYGEPLLHHNIFDIIKTFSPIANTELVTNGDKLDKSTAIELVNSGIGKVLVSLYDGPEQAANIQSILESAQVPQHRFLLRPRWHDALEDFGLILTNRAGTVAAGNQSDIKLDKECYYPHYMMMIEWNGDVFPCPQDWHRKKPMGNVATNPLETVWLSEKYKEFRESLSQANRCYFPCNKCNAKGVLHGSTHSQAWNRFYSDPKSAAVST